MIEPVDLTRCQAEYRQGSFLSFGISPLIRCSRKPIVVVTEKNPTPLNGEVGSMSLCEECFEVFQSRDDLPTVHVKILKG